MPLPAPTHEGPDLHAGHYSTLAAARSLGVTFRQLDVLARSLDWTPGSGAHRAWRPEWVARLRVARALLDVVGDLGNPGFSPFPRFARAVLDGPDPRRYQWVAWSAADGVTYSISPTHAVGGQSGAVVARIPRQESTT
jgi:hypothetical protein